MSTTELLPVDFKLLGGQERSNFRVGRSENLHQVIETVYDRLKIWRDNPLPLVEAIRRSFKVNKYVGALEPVEKMMGLSNNDAPLAPAEADRLGQNLAQYGLGKEVIEDLLVVGKAKKVNPEVVEAVRRLTEQQRLAMGNAPEEIRQQFKIVLGRVNRFASVSASQSEGGNELLPGFPGRKKGEGDRKGGKNLRSGLPGGCGCLAVFLLIGSCLLSRQIGEAWGDVSAWYEGNKLMDAGEWERAEALRLHQQYPDVTHAGVENANTRLTNILSGAESLREEMLRFDLGTFDNAGKDNLTALSGKQLSMALGWNDALEDAGLINQDGRLDADEQIRVIDKLKQLGVSAGVVKRFWQRFSWAYEHFDDYGVETNREQQGLEYQQQQVMAEVRMNALQGKQQEMLRRGVGRTSIADTGLGQRGPRRS
jgi:hypothetical protein